MSETAQHSVEDQDVTLEAINALSVIDLNKLSFVQLKRLQKILQQANANIEAETRRRSDSDSAGDTVQVQSPNA